MMTPHEPTLREIIGAWKCEGLPIHSPGFYDHPRYVRAEQAKPGYITTYARYVRDKFYNTPYLDRSEAVVRAAASVVSDEIREDGRSNLCVAACKVLAKMLEREGVWNYIVVGGCSVSFHIGPRQLTRSFFPFDVRPVDAAHAWVVAPPFRIIDLTLRQQRYPGPAHAYVPEQVLARRTSTDTVDAHEVCAPALLRGLRLNGLEDDDILDRLLAPFKHCISVFPPEVVHADSAAVKYVPIRIITPEGDLDRLRRLRINGKTPERLYQRLRARLGD
ncbi:MAG: hypothetical protein ACE5G0_01745 [Rhodothermales bacterium]